MLGPFEKVNPRSVFEGREVMIASVLSIVWLIVLAGYGAGYFGLLGDLAEPRDAAFLEMMFFLIVMILPLSLVWLGAALIRRSFEIQDEARRLERHVRELQSGGTGPKGVSQPRIKDNRVETLQQTVAVLSGKLKQLETTLTSVGQMQAALQVQATATSANPQGNLPFEPEEVAETSTHLDWSDLIRALNFPRDESDTEGFKALRLAKKNDEASQLLRAAEDILNFLAQEGIYMDDMRPVICAASDWREFASGKRGVEVTAVGGIDAPEAMERIAVRNATDQIFRDAALYFLRRFDIMLRAFTDGAQDAEIQALADTRTGRAFMLLGRAAGMFG